MLLLLAVWPGERPAQGALPGHAEVWMDGATLRMSAWPGQHDDVTLEEAAGAVVITHLGGPVDAGAGCTSATASAVACPAAVVARVAIDAGSGDDTVDLSALLDCPNAPTSCGQIPAAIDGGAGDDHLIGGAGNDAIDGGTGDDVIDGRGGADEIAGGTGEDTADYSSRTEPVYVSVRNLFGPDGQGTEGDDVHADVEDVRGGAGNDKLVGDSGANALSGEGGDDVLDGGLGPDTLSGGPGIDAAIYSERLRPVTVTLDGQPGDGEPGEGDNVLGDVEVLHGGEGADSFTGNGSDNLFYGGANEDTLVGGGGADTLYGGLDADRLEGGPGDDRLYGEEGDDVLAGDPGNDIMSGGKGFDTADYSGLAGPVTLDFYGGLEDGGPGERDIVRPDIEQALGTPAGDTLTGTDHVDTLVGTAGDDTIDGLRQADVILGGAGKDALSGGSGDDDIDAGPGQDAVSAGDGDDTIRTRDGERDTIACGDGKDTVLADAFDVIFPSDCEKVTLLNASNRPIRTAVRVRMKCPRVWRARRQHARCRGTLSLKIAKPRRTTLGSVRFDLRPGTVRLVRVKLRPGARLLLGRSGRLEPKVVVKRGRGAGHAVTKRSLVVKA